MSFVDKIKVCKTCDTIKVSDIAGLYSSDNTTGWGSPNLARDFTGTAILEIKYKTSVLQFDVKETIEDAVLPYFTLYSYTNASGLEDGVYTITVTLTDTENNKKYVTSKKITSECNVECCVAKLAIKAADECNCNTLDAENFSKAEQILSSLKSVAENLGEKEYYIQLAKLQKICETSNCGCGCS